MDKYNKDLDKIRGLLWATLDWLSLIEPIPLAYIDEDRTRVATSPKAYLEFGLHSWGSASDLRVGPHRRLSMPGTLVVMNAHFGNRGTPRQHWRFWCLSFAVTSAAPVRNLERTPLLLTAPLRDPASCGEKFALAARERNRAGPGRPGRLKGSVLLLLGELLDNLLPDQRQTAGRPPPVREAMEYMQAHYRDPTLSLTALAAKAHLSEAHFGRLFRRETGLSPMQFLAELRLARARELLRRTQLRIAEIADDVGYRDPAYFSRLFHRKTGFSPRRFRQTGGGT